jgi:fimbrial chaperone protein
MRLLTMLLVAVLYAPVAAASSFSVKPIQVYLTADTSTALLGITNESATVLRFQARMFAWAQSLKGDIQLAPTEDLVLFPTLLEVPPGQQRNVRIGARVPSGDVEKVYRVLITELPPEVTSESEGNVLKMLTEMSIPVFRSPVKKREGGEVVAAKLDHGKLYFAVHNTGNAHFVLNHVRVEGKDAAGKVAFRKQTEGWYVLANGQREYELPIPQKSCTKLKTLVIEATTTVNSFRTTLTVDPAACQS